MQEIEFEEGTEIAGLWLRPGRRALKDAEGTLIAIQQGTKVRLTFVYKDVRADFSFETVEQDEDGTPLPAWTVELPKKTNYFFGHGPIDAQALERAKHKIRDILPLGPWASEEKEDRVTFL